ncbi:phosphoribosyltransferase [Actinomycetospora straminea]|uniref:Phosphoribosyltransferase domain-containing protein n=1 Tax=Actinomycetospora straminea TaxID=663607 RepID=A0ABP9EJY9_9PSEU|nr:phosphoribosyltransferase family protein [Actinomycetospora straminea]MDD7933169.1 phosphoribosyltransferase family protein [Actinomycetospora straminea]
MTAGPDGTRRRATKRSARTPGRSPRPRRTVTFADRADAGHRLARRLTHLRDADPVVLALPRGGFPVAAEVARELGAPLDVVLVRKLGVPLQPELAMGAVGEGDVLVLNPAIVDHAGVGETELAEIVARARDEIARRRRRFRPDRDRVPLAGRTALLVDDGIATGATARAACRVVRAQGATRVVLAAPVCLASTADDLRAEVDELVCLETPEEFFGVGMSYADFAQVTDDEAVEILRRAMPPPRRGA